MDGGCKLSRTALLEDKALSRIRDNENEKGVIEVLRRGLAVCKEVPYGISASKAGTEPGSTCFSPTHGAVKAVHRMQSLHTLQSSVAIFASLRLFRGKSSTPPWQSQPSVILLLLPLLGRRYRV